MHLPQHKHSVCSTCSTSARPCALSLLIKHLTAAALLGDVWPCFVSKQPIPRAATAIDMECCPVPYCTCRYESHHTLVHPCPCGQGQAGDQHHRDVCRHGCIPAAAVGPPGTKVRTQYTQLGALSAGHGNCFRSLQAWNSPMRPGTVSASVCNPLRLRSAPGFMDALTAPAPPCQRLHACASCSCVMCFCVQAHSDDCY